MKLSSKDLRRLADVNHQHPIALAVDPLKQDAIQRAFEYAQDLAEKVRQELIKADWDINKTAPYPDSRQPRFQFMAQHQRYQLFSRLTKSAPDQSSSYRPHEPRYVVMDNNAVAKFYKEAREDAGFQYDLFVAKLIDKVGEVESARLEGNHVWGHSHLFVKKPASTHSSVIVEEIWKTQTIVNQSKLGLVFNQFPTRKVKHV